MSVTYTTAHSNARSLTHRARPGIEPSTSWFLVGFISAAPQWELLHTFFFLFFLVLFFVLFFCFLGLHPRHMEVARLGVEYELQLLAYTTATATWDPSQVCNLHYRSQPNGTLNPLSKARDRTCILTDTSQVPYC